MFSNWAYIVKTSTSTFLCSLAYILPRHRGTLYILKDTGTQQEEVKKSMGRALLLLTSFKVFFCILVSRGTSSSQNSGNKVVLFYGRLKTGQLQTMRFRI